MSALLPDVSYIDLGDALRCPVCATKVSLAEGKSCSRCGAPHHQACWDWAGGCSVVGCPTHGLLPLDKARHETVRVLTNRWSRCLREQRWGVVAVLAFLMLLSPSIIALGPLGVIVYWLLLLCLAHYAANYIQLFILRREIERIVPGHLATVGRPPELLRCSRTSSRDEARVLWYMLLALRIFGIILAALGCLLFVAASRGVGERAPALLPFLLGVAFAVGGPRLFGDRLSTAEGIRNRLYAGLERKLLDGEEPTAKL